MIGDYFTMIDGYIQLPELAYELQISVRRVQQIIKETGKQLPGKVVRMGHKGTWISPEASKYISAVVLHGKMFDFQLENTLLSREKERLEKEVNRLKISQGVYDLELVEVLLTVFREVKNMPTENSDCISKSQYWSKIISPLVEIKLLNDEKKHQEDKAEESFWIRAEEAERLAMLHDSETLG